MVGNHFIYGIYFWNRFLPVFIIYILIFYFLIYFAEVSEVVDAIVYLLSNHSSMINGITLPVDGGFLAT